MAHRPEIAASWAALDEIMRFGGLLPPGLKEEVRRTLAQHSGCSFCASLGQPSPASHDPRAAAAAHFALVFSTRPAGLSDGEFDTLHAHFSEAEIVELVAWISFMHASEMIGAVLCLDAATPEQLKGYGAWLQAGFARFNRARAQAVQ
jgi:alkylhydroperoxidase family enzyme